jgi:hypothetical protein
LDDAKAATVDEAPVKQAADAAAIAGISQERKKEKTKKSFNQMKKYQKKMKQQQKKSCLSTEKRFN